MALAERAPDIAAGVSITSATFASFSPLEWMQFIGGLVAIVAGIVSIYGNLRRKNA